MTGSALQPHMLVAGRFRLERELGRGGMGAVWLARHVELGVPCAIKFILVAHRADARARFDREAKAAAQLRSPHVVQILDYGTWQGIPYLAMEFLDGEDLRHRLDRVGRLAPGELLPLMDQIARGLSKAHQAGIVHRDLKPDNIFLARDDDRDLVKLLDFGVAKVASTEAGAGLATQTGVMLGTPYYMSPEQGQGNKQLDHRSDLFSLAVITYEALVGRRPFDSDALGDLLMRIMVHPLPVPSAAAPWLGPGFDQWWLRAAARDPGERFQSVAELVAALAQALGGPARDARASLPPQGGAHGTVPAVGALAGTNANLTRTAGAPGTPKAPVVAAVGALLLAAAGTAAFASRSLRGESAAPAVEPAREAAAASVEAPAAPPSAASTEPVAAAASPPAPSAPVPPPASATSHTPRPPVGRSPGATRPQAAPTPPTPPPPHAPTGKPDMGF